jgi:hypothetical protein
MSLRGKQWQAAGNSHHRGGNTLECGGDALAKLKKIVGQDASRRCVRRPGGQDRDPFSVRGPMETDQDGHFNLPVCVGPLKMP